MHPLFAAAELLGLRTRELGDPRGTQFMPSLKDLMEFMGASWPIALGVLLASSGILYADNVASSYLASLPKWAPGAAFVAALFSGSVLIVSALKSLINLARKPFMRKRRLAWQAEHVAGLEDLPDSERYILAWAIANSTQVVAAPYFNAHVKGLITRGYLLTTPGSHSINETPLLIPDHIWKALKEGLQGENLSALIGVRPFDRW
ncbi:hypothetical protein A6U98_27135 [Rhizobium sp. WYCCWR10014]|uniref:super-infection exclusion protein B n=1 Tax=Rhizobium sp. WYCCWR10014 TaxID=1825933 RepID=UPI0007E402F0|nr:super-infection exclusion protein B [Rhizobium sp. WYCCWR10014]OAV52473.1 hypothetical protein A6U98_27135 [Rhizobium sp. WYCCWR10014]